MRVPEKGSRPTVAPRKEDNLYQILSNSQSVANNLATEAIKQSRTYHEAKRKLNTHLWHLPISDYERAVIREASDIITKKALTQDIVEDDY